MNITRAQSLQFNGPNGSKCYGGNQEWYSSNTWAMGGCGSVAAANALRCLCLNNVEARNAVIASKKLPSQLKNALCSTNTNKENYSLLMTSIYKTMGTVTFFPLNIMYDKAVRGNKWFRIIKPNNGISSIGFIIGLIRFARKCGLDITVNALPTAFVSSYEGVAFIEDGLRSSGCVVLLTSYNKHNLQMYPAGCDLDKSLDSQYNPYDSSMKSHFAVISDIDLATDRLLISTWGKPAICDLYEITRSWRSIKAFESTLMYIELSTRKESNNCLLMSWKPFVLGILNTIIRRPFMNLFAK